MGYLFHFTYYYNYGLLGVLFVGSLGLLLLVPPHMASRPILDMTFGRWWRICHPKLRWPALSTPYEQAIRFGEILPTLTG